MYHAQNNFTLETEFRSLRIDQHIHIRIHVHDKTELCLMSCKEITIAIPII